MNALALITGIIALVVSGFSWRTAVHANRAAIFDRRFDVYTDAEKFISAWRTHGRPEMDQLGVLIGAWNRSQFLFEAPVTNYLRQLWLEAVDADYCSKVIAGEVQGDHGKAVEKMHRLTLQHMDGDRLRAQFIPQLKVRDGYPALPVGLAKRLGRFNAPPKQAPKPPA